MFFVPTTDLVQFFILSSVSGLPLLIQRSVMEVITTIQAFVLRTSSLLHIRQTA